MKQTLFIALFAFCTVCCNYAQQKELYSFDKNIHLPGDAGYDYLAIDANNHHLFVSHGDRVNVIDLQTDKAVGSIDSLQGVHGIAFVNDLNKGFITDGRANAVVVFDLTSFKKLGFIPVNGKNPDAIVYDPVSKKIFAINHSSGDASVIDPVTMHEIAVIRLGGGPEFAVADGRGNLFINLEDDNAMAKVDTRSMKKIANYPLLPCAGPTGLAMDKQQQLLFTVCGENKGMSVVNMHTGKVMATLPIGAGVDAAAYDPATRLVFSSNGEGTVTIIRQGLKKEYTVVQTLSTKLRARTMTLDLSTHKIYLSVADFEPGTRKAIPGSFSVLVYKMNQ